MNSAAILAADRLVTAIAAPMCCLHCGDVVVAGDAITGDRKGEIFCCKGCAAATQWIRDADLGDYYRLREAGAARVDDSGADAQSWDRDELLASHVRQVAGEREITVLTDSMRCAACAWLIDRALSLEPGVREVSANAVTGRIRLRWDPLETSLSTPIKRLLALGYRPFLGVGEAPERLRREQRNRDLLRIGVAGLGAMQAMMFAEALFLDGSGQMPIPTRDFLRWVTFLVSTPVVWYSGWPFLAGAWRELRSRRPGMDTLVAISVLLAYFSSVVETMRGGPHVWYDAAVMFVFLLLGARLLEGRARSLASAQVDRLARAQPVFVTRELSDGRREAVASSALQIGDVALVVAGEVIPADGTLLDSAAELDEALLTGESRPVLRQPGDTVFSGTLCRQRPLRLRVSECGTSTRLSRITQLVERAQAHRPEAARLADVLATRFVVIVFACAAATWLLWHGNEPGRALEVTLAVLAVSCPCALSLAVPTTLAVAHGALARCGVLALQPEALANLARATDMVFDKTGTLSTGLPEVTAVTTFGEMSEDRAMSLVAALERDTGHPIGAAFRAGDDNLAAMAVETVAGAGVSGVLEGVTWKFGHAGFALGRPDDGGLWLATDGNPAARFQVADALRGDAVDAVASLRRQGMRLHLASGDSSGPVEEIGTVLGITDARSRMTPEAKLAMVRALQADGRVVAMVGDGANDAPVIAGADVSIAIGGGAALARHAADFVLMGTSLARIPEAIAIARRCQALTRQNLAWAMAYNLLAIPAAASGLVTPWLAASGMALSSLLVSANALRVGRRWSP